MSLQREAIGAKCIASSYAAIWCKLSIAMVTNRALHLGASIKYGEYFHHRVTEKLKVLARYMSQKKANKEFHNYVIELGKDRKSMQAQNYLADLKLFYTVVHLYGKCRNLC